MHTFTANYIIYEPGGSDRLGTVGISAPSIFTASGRMEEMVNDYEQEFPSHKVLVLNIKQLATDAAGAAS